MEPGPLNPPTQSPSTPPPVRGATVPAAPPVWAQRLMLGVEVAVALWAGILVILLPWTNLWSANPLLAHWPAIQHGLNLNFVRGMISGVGLLDLWIGLSDAVHYRDIR